MFGGNKFPQMYEYSEFIEFYSVENYSFESILHFKIRAACPAVLQTSQLWGKTSPYVNVFRENTKCSIAFNDIIKIHLKIALYNTLHRVPQHLNYLRHSVSSEHGCFYSTNKSSPEISILMHCLFKRARGQEWRCYQLAIHHGHDTLSAPLPHLQAMLYRTNTSPRAVQSSIFLCYALELHEYPHTVYLQPGCEEIARSPSLAENVI